MLRLLSCIRYYLIPILSILVLSNCSNNLTGVEEQEFNDLIPDLKKQCYMIGVAIEGKMYGLGSGFAISNKRIMTNAHVVNGLV